MICTRRTKQILYLQHLYDATLLSANPGNHKMQGVECLFMKTIAYHGCIHVGKPHSHIQVAYSGWKSGMLMHDQLLYIYSLATVRHLLLWYVRKSRFMFWLAPLCIERCVQRQSCWSGTGLTHVWRHFSDVCSLCLYYLSSHRVHGHYSRPIIEACMGTDQSFSHYAWCCRTQLQQHWSTWQFDVSPESDASMLVELF